MTGKSMDEKEDRTLDYFSILGRSWQIVKKNKHLWFLGVLAGAAGSNFSLNGGSGNFGGSTNNASSPVPVNVENFFNTVGAWVQSHVGLVIIVGFMLAIFGLIWWAFSVMATGGLINAVDKLDNSEDSSFMVSMRFGWYKFWRILGLSLLLGLYGIGVFLLLALPALLLGFSGLWVIFVLYVILAILFFVVFGIALGIVSQYSLRYATLLDKKIMDSIRAGYGLLKKNKKEALFLFLMNILIGFMGALAAFAAIFLAVLALGSLGLVLWAISSSIMAIIVYAIPAVLICLTVMMLIGGFFSAFVSSYWTLAFKELNKRKTAEVMEAGAKNITSAAEGGTLS